MTCLWPGSSEMMQAYHDQEWCVPNHDDRYLFEMLTLEGAQSGLSWSIVLSRRDSYKEAFHNFDIAYCAALTDADLENIKENCGVIKHMAKLQSVRSNAQAVLNIQTEFGSFSDFLWRYADFKPIVNEWEADGQMPAETPLSKQLSKDLKKRGFKFVGPVTMYSFMQAIGMVDDHVKTCPYHTSNSPGAER
ncbi:DNA-3-methyladenine glycosylase I [Bacillus massiliglaciei]|uniref:DNA-3-methyladenine glycosylase I n=1 Tax=Bacillus massiliglaciei TaxID=1816693 RepID=UPI000AB6F876|nr:DNA-3-methyladenine glycosylase I [Bacillus massiliglaciei]